MTGCVYLVGAGPGDPALLTVRAHELVRGAEVLAHDELISPEILALAPPGAERIAVGRRRGRGAVPWAVHPAIVERARAGRAVVRLKCGDPFVLGRGGEELATLTAAGIAVEVVPGITAALGVAAASGIPLTHRGITGAVTLATAHDDDAAAALARAPGTLCLYMASHRLDATCAALIAGGRATTTPAALVIAATTPHERIVAGTLADLPARAGAPGADAGLLVVGEVVARRPLAGRRVLVGRARPGRSRVAAALRGLGADVVEAPAVAIEPRDAAVPDADAAVVGCAAGARAHAAAPARPAEVIAVGAAAADALAAAGVPIAARARGACAAALAEHAPRLAGRRIALVAGDAGRPALRRELAALGADVVEVAAYRAVAHAAPIVAPVDAIALPSSSAARALAGALGDAPVVAIGPDTAAAARALGARRVVTADRDDVPALVAAVIATLAEAP